MFGRSQWLDLISSLLLMAVLMALLALAGMNWVIPLRFPDANISQNFLTLSQHATYDFEQAAIERVRTALQQGILDACVVAAGTAALWFLSVALWRPDRPKQAGFRGYLWSALTVGAGVAAWFVTVTPLQSLLTIPEAILPFRVLASGWAVLCFILTTWIATPSIAVPALGPLGRLRFAAIRPFKSIFSRGTE